MNIIKFGGAVLKNNTGFQILKSILTKYYEPPVLLVVSAFSHVTRQLYNAAYLAESGSVSDAKKIADDVYRLYYTFSSELLIDKTCKQQLIKILNTGKTRLYELLRGVAITKQLTPRTLDSILSFGEYFALYSIYYFLLSNGFKIGCIDATSFIVTDENYGSANPLFNKTKARIERVIKPALQNYDIIITQGFVGKSVKHQVTTMGFESSNFTAVLLADILNIPNITFWTDVEGIRSADPKLVKDTKVISQLDYSYAYRLSQNGLKLVHHKMIDYADENNIELIYRNAFNPNGESSTISKKVIKAKQPVLLLSAGFNARNFQFSNNADKNEIGSEMSKAKNDADDYFMSMPDSITCFTKKRITPEFKQYHKGSLRIKENVTLINILDAGGNSNIKNIISLIDGSQIYNFIYDHFGDIFRIWVPERAAGKLLSWLHKYYYGI